MVEYKNGQDNTSRGRGGMSFRDRGLSTRGRVLIVVRIILESILIAIEPITLLTNVGSCMANLPGLFELFICLVLLDYVLHMTLILLVLLLMNM